MQMQRMCVCFSYVTILGTSNPEVLWRHLSASLQSLTVSALYKILVYITLKIKQNN